MLKSVPKLPNITKQFRIKLLLAIGIAVIIPILSFITLYFVHNKYKDKILPGVMVAGYHVGGLSPKSAAEFLEAQVDTDSTFILTSENQTFEISPDLIEFSYDFDQSAYAAFSLAKTNNPVSFVISLIKTYQLKPSLPLIYIVNEEKLNENLSIIAGQIATEPLYPEAKLTGEEIVIEKGRAGQNVNIENLREQISLVLETNGPREIKIPVNDVDPSLSDGEVEVFRNRASTFIGKSFNLKFEDRTYTYKDSDVVALLNYEGFSKEKVSTLVAKLASQINRPVQNAVFRFEDGRVQEFLPAKSGIIIDEDTSSSDILQSLSELSKPEEEAVSVVLSATQENPVVTTKEVNELGINELLGRGESNYRGSIASRVHNVGLSASKFNGVLLEPGQILSFNDILGDVSVLTGYKQAYIIQDGKTVLGDGGGVCQVSTTLFRAALNAGLPIVERRAHSYRVTYYEQGFPPGLDATVYSPTTDFKIKNDTPNHILIQTINDPKNTHLTFEIYGTSDGRKATISKPVVSSVSPPPEDLYTDDPTLPEGQIKQIDWKAWGAKVTFNYTVERNGETIIQKTFVSNYRPWQAKFLRGTGPAI